MLQLHSGRGHLQHVGEEARVENSDEEVVDLLAEAGEAADLRRPRPAPTTGPESSSSTRAGALTILPTAVEEISRNFHNILRRSLLLNERTF